MTDTAIDVRKVTVEGKMRAGVVGLLCGFLTLAANLATAQPAPDGTAAWDKIESAHFTALSQLPSTWRLADPG